MYTKGKYNKIEDDKLIPEGVNFTFDLYSFRSCKINNADLIISDVSTWKPT